MQLRVATEQLLSRMAPVDSTPVEKWHRRQSSSMSPPNPWYSSIPWGGSEVQPHVQPHGPSSVSLCCWYFAGTLKVTWVLQTEGPSFSEEDGIGIFNSLQQLTLSTSVCSKWGGAETATERLFRAPSVLLAEPIVKLWATALPPRAHSARFILKTAIAWMMKMSGTSK